MTVVMMLRAIVDALNGIREELKMMNDILNDIRKYSKIIKWEG